MINRQIILFSIIFAVFCCVILTAAERFPSITPNRSGMLQVDNLHSIYWEESGNPAGVPVIFLHGGPGGGTDASQRTFFDPNYYRIILFDQRGCGKSSPHRCLMQNTTWDLVEDINQLRKLLHIDRCLLFGGSWGSTLALAYSIKYPENVLGLIVRGIFFCRQQEFDWFYKDGANHLSPEAWKIFVEYIPEEKRNDLIGAYHHYLHSNSAYERYKASATWMLWEVANMYSKPDYRVTAVLSYRVLFYAFMALYADQNQTSASIENHYLFNKGFFETDNWIMKNIDKIQKIPGFIIQGEDDQICRWQNAQELHEAWPRSVFLLLPNAGHSVDEPGTIEALIYATESFKKL